MPKFTKGAGWAYLGRDEIVNLTLNEKFQWSDTNLSAFSKAEMRPFWAAPAHWLGKLRDACSFKWSCGPVRAMIQGATDVAGKDARWLGSELIFPTCTPATLTLFSYHSFV